MLKHGSGTSFKSSLSTFHVTSVPVQQAWVINLSEVSWVGRRCRFYRLHLELTVGFHESLTCLTVCGQDRVCAAESIWTEGGKSGLEKTTTWPGCRTHIHFAWWTCTHWCILSFIDRMFLWWWRSTSCRTTRQYEANTGQKPSSWLRMCSLWVYKR